MRKSRVLLNFLAYFRPYKIQICLAVTTLILLTIGSLARPHILRFIIDGSLAGNWSTIYWGAGSFVVILLASVGLSYAQLIITAKIGIDIVNQLNLKHFKK